MLYKLVFLLLLAILIAVFAVSNPGVVEVNLVVWKSQKISLALVILLAVLCGALMIGIFSVFEQIKNALTIRRLKQKISEHEEKTAVLEGQVKKQKDASAGEFLKDTYDY